MRIIIISLVFSLIGFGCKKLEDVNYSVDTTNESAQQVGEAMASIDESSGSTSGQLAQLEYESYEKAFARMTDGEPAIKKSILNLALPEAQAATCASTTFSTCSGGLMTRTFADCTLGANATISGSVSLTFTNNSCLFAANGESVTRKPDFTISGIRGASFTVKATSSGQTLTRSGSGVYTFSSAGIRRTFVTPKGSTLLDITTSTSGDLTVTGQYRSGRVVSNTGGSALVVTNNLTNVTCSMTPNSVTWGSTCNCPTGGSWSSSCSDNTSFSVQFSSTCGAVTVNKNGVISSVTLDRCVSQ